MRHSDDFVDPQSLIEEARIVYSEIYYWHAAHGQRKFEECFRERDESEGLRTQYLGLVAELVKPQFASIDDMLKVAREVLSGRMEWACGEKSDERGVTLGNWARRIQEYLKEYQKRQEERDKELARQEAGKSLLTFRSLSTNGKIANGARIEIPLQHNESWSLEGYLAYANSAYHDVPETDNVGGKVFLIQTNLEHARENKSGYTFRNAKLLHVEAIAGENNLAELLRNGDLIVENLILGE